MNPRGAGTRAVRSIHSTRRSEVGSSYGVSMAPGPIDPFLLAAGPTLDDRKAGRGQGAPITDPKKLRDRGILRKASVSQYSSLEAIASRPSRPRSTLAIATFRRDLAPLLTGQTGSL